MPARLIKAPPPYLRDAVRRDWRDCCYLTFPGRMAGGRSELLKVQYG